MDVRIGPWRVWSPKNWCFVTAVLEKTLESSLDSKIKPVNPKGKKPWILTRKTDAEAKTPILWPPDVIHSISLDHFTPPFYATFPSKIFSQITICLIVCLLLLLKLCLTLWDLMDGSLPGSSVHGISQSRILEWVAISLSMILVFKLVDY